MEFLTVQKLLEYNRLGLIPGPAESEQAFMQRANYCLNLKNHIPQMISADLPFDYNDTHLSEEILKKGCEKTQHYYDICPTWVPLFFSNFKLSPWHGGCAWIFQQSQDSPTSAFFQLRQNFRRSKKYLGIYERNELITHEVSHIGRMMFEEPKFEEILAYHASQSGLRRFFGPIIQSSYESTIFVLSLFLVILIDFMAISNGYSIFSPLSFIARLIALGLIIFGLVRLWIRQNQFRSCLKNLRKALFSLVHANAVIYRLTDKEIISFAHQSPENIKRYAEEQKTQNLRWQVIHEAYFKQCASTDHYDGIKFHNNPPLEHSFKMFLKWITTRKPAQWPKKIDILNTIPAKTVNENELSITFVNHSTFLIQLGRINILTDPIWSNRCGPFKCGPKRIHSPGIHFEDLPKIDLVLLSHNHYDHMDLPTLKKLQVLHQPIFITGLGNWTYLEKKGLEKIIELDWWQEFSLANYDLKVFFVPAQHFSMRNLFNRNETLWGGFILKKRAKTLYFAGDTAYTHYFEEIKKRLGSPYISFLPIGAFEPRWFMKVVHMSPQDAINAHKVLGSSKSIAMHFGSFHLSDETFDEPVKQLKKDLEKENFSNEAFWIAQPGNSYRDNL